MHHSIIEDMYEHPLTVSNALRDINTEINAIHRSMKDVVLAENNHELALAIETVNKSEKTALDAYRVVFERFLGDKENVELAYRDFVNWHKIRSEVITLKKQKREKEAAEITKGKGALHVQKMFESNRGMMDFAQSKADEYYLATKEKYNNSYYTLLIILGLTILISVFITMYISNSISKPIRIIIERIKSNLFDDGIYNGKATKASEQSLLDLSVSKLESLTVKLKTFNNELESKVEQRTKDLNELKVMHELILNNANIGIYGTDLNGNATFINKTAERLTLWNANELIGKKLHDFLHVKKNKSAPTQPSECGICNTQKWNSTKSNKNEVFWSKEGKSFPVEFSSSDITDINNKKMGAVVAFNDITEKINAEKTITQYGKLLENSLNEMFIFDAKSLKFVDVNKGARKNIGRTLEELTEITPLDLNPELTKEQFQEYLKPLDTGAEDIVKFTTSHLRKDNTLYPAQLCIQKALFKGKSVYVAFVFDITVRVENEKRLERTNKSLEEMVYIASHDLQVPLVSMEGYSTELLENYKEQVDEDGLHCLKRLQDNARRMHKLVLSLLDISRLNTVKNKHIGFNAKLSIERILSEMNLSIIKYNAQVKLHSIPDIIGDKERIESVFRNVISNALKYEGKNISIGFENNAFAIKDDGIGIPKGQEERIFKPGERLKMNNAEGVGMGLTFCKKVMEQHDGNIWVEPNIPKGTSIFIKFPHANLKF